MISMTIGCCDIYYSSVNVSCSQSVVVGSSYLLQWNTVNTDTKETCHSVRIKRALRENVRDICFIDIKQTVLSHDHL